MSDMTTVNGAWQELWSLRTAVAGEWLNGLGPALVGLQPVLDTSGWWRVTTTASVFGHPVDLQLVAHPANGVVALAIDVGGYVAPSQIFGSLLFGGQPQATALDFLGLDTPRITIANQEVSGVGAILLGGSAGDVVAEGLTISGTIPDTSRLDAFPRTLTRPLKYVLDDTHALPARLELTVGSSAATAMLFSEPTWTPADLQPGVTLTLSNRQIGASLDRNAPGAVPTRSAPAKTAADGQSEPATTDTLTMQTDVDLTISLIGTALPFPHDDTARMTLGAEITGGRNADGSSDAEADGWLRLRGSPPRWNNPFGMPSMAITALYGRVDIARRALKAFRGEATFAGYGFDVGLMLAAQRSENLVALRNQTDVPLLGVGAALLEASGAISGAGPVLVAQAPRTTDTTAEIDPTDYALYFSSGTRTFDDTTWPPGLRIKGDVRFWSLATAGVDLGVTWTDGAVTMSGTGLSLKIGGVGCAIDLSSVLDALPLRITVTPELAIDVEVDYRLDLGGFSAQGTVRLGPQGAIFDLPSAGGIWNRDPDLGLTGISATGSGLEQLKVSAFVSKTISVALPGNPLPGALQALPGGKAVSAIGELHFAVDISTDPNAIGVGVTRLVGRIPALNVEENLSISGLHVDVNDLRSAASLVESALRTWATRIVEDLFANVFGQIPVLGPLLRNAFGIADEGVGRILAVADGLDIPLGTSDLKAAIGQAGIALDKADRVLSGAMDWARGNGIQLGAGMGGWAIGGLSAGFDGGLKLVGELLSDIPGFDDTLGKWAGDIGGLFKKKSDHAPSAEARDTASKKASEGGVMLLYQQRELGGQSFAFPLGRYPQMPEPLRPNGAGNGANSLVLPRGWTVRVWANERFTGASAWFDLTTNDMGDWVDRVQSFEVMRQGKVMFFEDDYYREWQGQESHNLDVYAATGTDGHPGPHYRPWLKQTTSIMVPEGWRVDLWNESHGHKMMLSSTHDIGWLFGGGWNDKLTQARVTPPAGPVPAQWQAPSAPIAWGRSAPAAWRLVAPQTVGVAVDLSPHGFSAPPRIFTTLAGDSTGYAAYGVNAPHRVTATGFQVTVSLPADSPMDMLGVQGPWNWRLNWVAFADDAPMLVQGSTAAFDTYNHDPRSLVVTALHADQPTRSDGAVAPALTALRGVLGNPSQTGAGASYHVGETQLSVYLHSTEGALHPAMVRGAWGWQLDWCRPIFGRAGTMHRGTRMHAGRTTPGAGWQAYGAKGATLRVDTRDLDLPDDVIYVTAISGDSSHWTLTGGSAVYESDRNGFRIYVRDIGNGYLTPARARAGGWHIHWMAIGSA